MRLLALTTGSLAVAVATLNGSPQVAPETQAVSAPALLQLAGRALSPDPAGATAAIQSLRDAGPAGLDALFEAHAALITNNHPGPFVLAGLGAENPEWVRVRSALDAVAQQRDSHVSHLYWFTDLERAKAEAAKQHKPILSLRLLGRLNEDRSCANSRYFRTTLYANAQVSRFLRQHFVLHWQSVRPVPVITIDFGDGRKIERTITGNSIHYVLDSQGRVIDALPGLYGPGAFLCGLTVAQHAATDADRNASDFDTWRAAFHRDRLAVLATLWAQDLERIGVTNFTDSAKASPAEGTKAAVSPQAVLACHVTVTKAGSERPLLQSMPIRRHVTLKHLGEMTESDDAWARLAALHLEDARLDPSSRQVIRTKHLNATVAARLALSKSIVEDPMIRVIQNLENSISEDTVRNEYQLHSQIHEWFVQGIAPDSLDALNSKIYAELFLTPDSDPWLGLVPAETFSALDNNGLVQSTATTTLR